MQNDPCRFKSAILEIYNIKHPCEVSTASAQDRTSPVDSAQTLIPGMLNEDGQ